MLLRGRPVHQQLTLGRGRWQRSHSFCQVERPLLTISPGGKILLQAALQDMHLRVQDDKVLQALIDLTDGDEEYAANQPGQIRTQRPSNLKRES